MTEEVEPLIADELNVRAGKQVRTPATRLIACHRHNSCFYQRAQISSSFKLSSHSNPMELLDNMEAAFRHEVNKFNFPERLDFLDTIARDASAPGTPPSPVLSHASDNMSVRAHEQALSDLLANMDALANYEDEDVRMRQLQLGSKIRRELEELDRKVLEAWAASRRYMRN
ncbi:hypothetical protein BDV93DRAFT_519886 [Ceratobasidium sp. AG-I]|nr:hypothetical protein BDV93DRAFT_519886 [Ceratobasidium sp. AG-I]